jgi:hypothetical protein
VPTQNALFDSLAAVAAAEGAVAGGVLPPSETAGPAGSDEKLGSFSGDAAAEEAAESVQQEHSCHHAAAHKHTHTRAHTSSTQTMR